MLRLDISTVSKRKRMMLASSEVGPHARDPSWDRQDDPPHAWCQRAVLVRGRARRQQCAADEHETLVADRNELPRNPAVRFCGEALVSAGFRKFV
jgi:hypothetical protein